MPRQRKTPEYRDPYRHCSTGNGEYATYYSNSGQGAGSGRGILKMGNLLGESPRALGRRILHSDDPTPLPNPSGPYPGSYPWKTEPPKVQNNENTIPSKVKHSDYMYDQYGNLQELGNKTGLTGKFWNNKNKLHQLAFVETGTRCMSDLEVGGLCNDDFRLRYDDIKNWPRDRYSDYYGPQYPPDYTKQMRNTFHPSYPPETNRKTTDKRKKKKKVNVKKDESFFKEVSVQRSRYCAICSVKYDCATSEHNLDKIHIVKSELCEMGCALCFVTKFPSFEKLTCHMKETTHQQLVKLSQMKAKMIQEAALLETVTQEPSETGEEHVVPISGSYCLMCREFIHPEKGDKTEHCQSKIHQALYYNYMKNYKSLEKSVADKIVKLSQKKTSDNDTDDLSESEIERKIKIIQQHLISRNINQDSESHDASDSKDHHPSLTESNLVRESTVDSDSVMESTVESDGNVTQSEINSSRKKGSLELETINAPVSNLYRNQEIKSQKDTATKEKIQTGISELNPNMDVMEERPILRCPNKENVKSPEPIKDTNISSVPNKDTHISDTPNKETDISSIPNKDTNISAIPNKDKNISAIPNKETDISAIPNKETNISAISNKETNISSFSNLKVNYSKKHLVSSWAPNKDKTSHFNPNTKSKDVISTFVPNNDKTHCVNPNTKTKDVISADVPNIDKTNLVHPNKISTTDSDLKSVTMVTLNMAVDCKKQSDESHVETAQGREPIVKGREPIVKGREPIVKGGEPIVKGREPTVKGREPTVKGGEPTVKEREPIVKGSEPIVKGREPTVKGREPTVKGREPIVKGREPIVKGDIITTESQLIQTDIDMLESAIFDCDTKGSNPCSEDKREITCQSASGNGQKLNEKVCKTEVCEENDESLYERLSEVKLDQDDEKNLNEKLSKVELKGENTERLHDRLSQMKVGVGNDEKMELDVENDTNLNLGPSEMKSGVEKDRGLNEKLSDKKSDVENDEYLNERPSEMKVDVESLNKSLPELEVCEENDSDWESTGSSDLLEEPGITDWAKEAMADLD